MTELGPHLERLGLEQYLDAFVGEGFDTWETLLDIQESDFDVLNVKLGHRRKLQRAIAEYRGIPYERLIAPTPYEGASDGTKLADGLQGPSAAAPAVPGAETKRKYRRHPKPDENAPDRPPSAYVIFSNKVREEVKDQNLSFTQIAKLVGDRWQKLDLSGKEPYEAQANAVKERYNIQLSTYKKTDSYKEYMQYLADFKAKHGGAAEQKRPKLDPESSGGSVSGKSLEMADLLMPSQGHIRGGSTGSMASTAIPSPASTLGPLTLQTQGPGMMAATRLQSVASRGESPPNPHGGRDFSRRGQASQQSSISDDSSAKRSDSDPLARTASLSLSTPPSSTPPLPPLHPSGAVSEYGFGQDISRLRFPASGLQAGTALGGPMGHQSTASYPFPQTLPSPSISEGSWRGRGNDLRSYLDSGRSIPPPTYPTSGALTGVISLPPLGGSDRIGDIASQRTLPLPRSSPTTHQQQRFPPPARATESPHPYRQGQVPGPDSTQSPLDRSESDAADALAGLAGFPSVGTRPDGTKPGEQQWPR